jgi:methanogenic corrinoid protein MtbC1
LVDFPRRRLIEGIIVPLLAQVGNAWVKGRLGMANEHMASAVVRSLLGSLLQESASDPQMPGIVVATLSGQFHELGAMTVALAAADAGWRPLYLGPNLPAEEVAATVEQTAACAAAVSVAASTNSQQLLRETIKLAGLLEGRAVLFAGGQASATFRSSLDRAAIRWCDTLEAFHYALLDEELHGGRDVKP